MPRSKTLATRIRNKTYFRFHECLYEGETANSVIKKLVLRFIKQREAEKSEQERERINKLKEMQDKQARILHARSYFE